MAPDPAGEGERPRRFPVTKTRDRGFTKEYIAQLHPDTLGTAFPDTAVGEFLLIRNEVTVPSELRDADAEASDEQVEAVPETVVTELHTPIHANDQLGDGELGLDFTLRTALGAPSQLEVEHGEAVDGSAVEVAEIEVEPFDNPEDWLGRRFLNWALGVRPQVCRVRMGVFPDLEDKVCRLPKNTMQILGVEEGENVVVESTRGGRIVRGIKAFEIDEERRAIKERQKEDPRRYPSCEALLGLQQIRRTKVDIPEIWIDEEARVELGLQDRYKHGVCQPVRVYRDTEHLLGQMLYQFAIPLVLVIIAAGFDVVDVLGLLPAVLVWGLATLIWMVVLAFQSHSRLS